MNKKLLAVAVAAAMAVPAVNANAATGNVTVYGKLHMSVDSVDQETVETRYNNNTGAEISKSTTAGYDGQGIASRASRLGFKGSEKLGNGLKAVWKLEYSLMMDNPSNGLGGKARDHYLGLAGDWGTALLAGRVNTPYKNSTGKMDFFGDTLADYNSTVGFEDNRANNAIVYISPKFNGLQFAGAIVAGEGADSVTNVPTNTVADGLADGYSLGVTYKGNGLHLAAGYEGFDEEMGMTESKWRVGAMYAMNAFKVAAVYEDQSDVDGTVGLDAQLYQVSGAYTMGNNTIKAMYGHANYELGAGEQDGDGFAIGVDHKLSKRTKVYGVYTDSEMGVHGESNKGLYNAKQTLNEGPLVTTTTTTDASGFSLGIIHKF